MCRGRCRRGLGFRNYEGPDTSRRRDMDIKNRSRYIEASTDESASIRSSSYWWAFKWTRGTIVPWPPTCDRSLGGIWIQFEAAKDTTPSKSKVDVAIRAQRGSTSLLKGNCRRPERQRKKPNTRAPSIK